MSYDDEDIVAECPNCGQALRENDTYCRKCGEDVSDLTSGGGGCFIATAAYRTPFAKEIDFLRKWRDISLMNNPFGRTFVRFYYTVSPSIANVISKNEKSRKVIRVILNPFVHHLKKKFSN